MFCYMFIGFVQAIILGSFLKVLKRKQIHISNWERIHYPTNLVSVAKMGTFSPSDCSIRVESILS